MSVGKYLGWVPPLVGGAAVGTALMLVASCGAFDSTDIVDTKVELNLPDGKGTCYMMEIDMKNGAGEDTGESFYCAPKDEYDKNRVGEEWVGADGRKK